ncbi:hypothetical protein TVAG_241850 [Trichomonas vaginalis G3]|uniref:Uncharacterized protein n=1 Tax=Trichomonas vaginalis (strain ATCC PRA-98 / G3) TaxID=412133 RepID=A2FKS4_TRIV3|nr:hypothetical protein TVAGG3_0727400 [Trichomonas vaginalis G3]EAX94498.1 hypothetical protein TVAG_241850 [Trichomonas vaginalis G3]KAI5511002.1 hypothetical protein TVAGG3_0727400 [Trichomonas vaginalis G3]|eukprot:XP_001307428.1 hypothetical protein [Trichomonas vaginalis G3]
MEKGQDGALFYTFTDKATHEEEEETQQQPAKQEETKEEPVHEPQSFEMVYNPRFGVRIPQDRFLRFGKTRKSTPQQNNQNTTIQQKSEQPREEEPKPVSEPKPVQQPPQRKSPRQAETQEVKVEKKEENNESSLPALKPKPKTARRSYTSPIKKPAYKKPVLSARQKRELRKEKISNEVLEHPMCIPSAPKDLALLLERLEIDLEKALDLERYLEVEKISRIMNSAEIKLEKANKDKENQRYLKIANTHNSLCAIASSKVEQWNNKYDAFAEKVKKHINEVNSKNKKELAEFDETAPEPIPKKYSLVADKITRLRQKQMKAAMRLDFEKALIYKIEADELDSVDESVAYDKKIREFLKKREFLIKQQQKRIDTVIMHAQSRQFIMIKERQNLITGYGARIENIEQDLENHLLKGDFTLDEIEDARVYDEGESLMLSLRETKAPIKNN